MCKNFEQLVKDHPDWDEETLFNEGVVEFGKEDAARAIIRQVRGGNAGTRPDPVRPGGGSRSKKQQNRSPKTDDRNTKFKLDGLTAPYRFVALNETVTLPESTVLTAWKGGTLHSTPIDGGLSGTLDIEIAFDGPMLIGEPSDNVNAPLQMGDAFVIPGATLRGMTRSVMEIAAYARLSQTNLHRRYGIRDFGHHLFREEARKNVKSGWLRPWQNGDPVYPDGKEPDYVIDPCRYYLVKIRDFRPDGGASHLRWLNKSMLGRYDSMKMKHGKQVDFSQSQSQSFSLRNSTDSLPSVTPDKGGNIKGLYVFCNTSTTLKGITADILDEQEREARKGNQKKTECVFETVPFGSALPVSRMVWENFIANNSRPSQHAPKPIGNWALLKPTLIPEGKVSKVLPARIPVFWVEDSDHGVADLGLVRVFKRAHTYSVADVLNRTGDGCHRVDIGNFNPDFVEALFGFVHEPEETGGVEAKDHPNRHLKGRLSFGFARLDKTTPGKVSETVKSVMSAPQPSFSPFYLASTNNKDWSDSTARLAGRKRYPARNADGKAVRDWLNRHKGNDNQDTLSTLKFLEAAGEEPLRFGAQIRLHNVTRAELGALLWCLTFGDDSTKRHMIGRAKTAGAGQARIIVTHMTLDTNDGGAAPDKDTLLAAFGDHMRKSASGWPATEAVKDLLATAKPEFGETLKLDYLPLKEHRKVRDAVYNKDDPPQVNKERPSLLSIRLPHYP